LKHLRVGRKAGFAIVGGTQRSQGATMVIEPGSSEGGPDNRHDADQWLYVIAGTGRAVVEGKEMQVQEGSWLLIEAGETHEIENTGDELLCTINVYAPPAYD
jgi:mannose-6-phosphate isomerase-like protein (cupin superfamily)